MVGMNDNEAEYLNPINAPYFLSIVLASAFAFILGIINLGDGSDKALAGALIFCLIGTFFFIGIMWKECIHRPLSVTMSNDGILLKFRFNRAIHIDWNDILWISASTGKGVSAEGVSGKGGGIKANRGAFYSVTYEVGHAAQERYVQTMGRRPLTRVQYIELKGSQSAT